MVDWRAGKAVLAILFMWVKLVMCLNVTSYADWVCMHMPWGCPCFGDCLTQADVA